MAVFLDTSFVFALRFESDRRARDLAFGVFDGSRGAVLSSDYVYDECMVLTGARSTRAADLATMDAFFLAEDSPVRMVRVDQRAFEEARAAMLAQPVRPLSFTDWTTLVLARRYRAKALATFDKGLAVAFAE
jgi:predicted nucleic acid-binding protein